MNPSWEGCPFPRDIVTLIAIVDSPETLGLRKQCPPHMDSWPCWQTGHPMPTQAPPTQDS